jgi:hypothetical protein
MIHRTRLFFYPLPLLMCALSAFLMACPTEMPNADPVDCSVSSVAPPCDPPEFEIDPDVVYGKEGAWPRVILNEIMASNHTTVSDGTGRWADWLELKNLTGETVDLEGWSLSDDPDTPDKHVLDAMEIRGDRYLLLWGDNSPALGPDHLAFALAVDGDELGLYAPDGTTMDFITYGQQASDVALARVPDGTGVWELRAAATPGAANGGSR